MGAAEDRVFRCATRDQHDSNSYNNQRVKPDSSEPPSVTRNYVTLVLDSQTTDITNLKQVREGTIKYIKEQISDGDAVAIMSVTNGLQLLHPFTHDKAKLIAALEDIGVRSTSKNFEQQDLAENINALRGELQTSNTSPTITSPAGGSNAARIMLMRTVLAQFIKLRTALSLQQSRPILAAIAAICEGLRPIPGKKTLVLFSQGFVTPAVLDWQVQSTIDIANRANVAIYIIDSAGLRASAPNTTALGTTLHFQEFQLRSRRSSASGPSVVRLFSTRRDRKDWVVSTTSSIASPATPVVGS
jgi:VWFA-related protein